MTQFNRIAQKMVINCSVLSFFVAVPMAVVGQGSCIKPGTVPLVYIAPDSLASPCVIFRLEVNCPGYDSGRLCRTVCTWNASWFFWSVYHCPEFIWKRSASGFVFRYWKGGRLKFSWRDVQQQVSSPYRRCDFCCLSLPLFCVEYFNTITLCPNEIYGIRRIIQK